MARSPSPDVAGRRLDLTAELWDGTDPAALAPSEQIYRELITIGVDGGLAFRAGNHTDGFRLRGDDAVHLAAAVGLGTGKAPSPTGIRVSPRRPRALSSGSRLPVAPPAG